MSDDKRIPRWIVCSGVALFVVFAALVYADVKFGNVPTLGDIIHPGSKLPGDKK